MLSHKSYPPEGRELDMRWTPSLSGTQARAGSGELTYFILLPDQDRQWVPEGGELDNLMWPWGNLPLENQVCLIPPPFPPHNIDWCMIDKVWIWAIISDYSNTLQKHNYIDPSESIHGVYTLLDIQNLPINVFHLRNNKTEVIKLFN